MRTLLAVLILWPAYVRAQGDLVEQFLTPPDSARPGVYWYFMDGNLNREEMVKNLESMKNQGDWAFCMGINRFVYHTFAHKPLGDEHRPGMTMGPYGVHWDRGRIE